MISKTGLGAVLSSNYANESKKTEGTNKQTTEQKETTKVESLKKQIQNGEYKVDLDLLSQVIADELE